MQHDDPYPQGQKYPFAAEAGGAVDTATPTIPTRKEHATAIEAATRRSALVFAKRICASCAC